MDGLPPEPRRGELRGLADRGEKLTVRELVKLFGFNARRGDVTNTIRSELRAIGLSTEPPLEYGSLDTIVHLVDADLHGAQLRPNGHGDDSAAAAEPSDGGSQLHIGQIPSALGGLTAVAPDTTLGRAQTQMIRYDYSQLPVIQGSELRGVISWESIARASLHGGISTVADAMATPVTVDQDADLLASIDDITLAGYVIVLDRAGRPTGIVTTADLANQFDRLARPFLSVGECERELRRVLDATFTKDELFDATKFVKDGEKRGAAGMTLGDIEHFLDDRSKWKRLTWQLSRGAFIEWLQVVRELRNEIAHFSQDDEPIDETINQVRNLTNFLRER